MFQPNDILFSSGAFAVATTTCHSVAPNNAFMGFSSSDQITNHCHSGSVTIYNNVYQQPDIINTNLLPNNLNFSFSTPNCNLKPDIVNNGHSHDVCKNTESSVFQFYGGSTVDPHFNNADTLTTNTYSVSSSPFNNKFEEMPKASFTRLCNKRKTEDPDVSIPSKIRINEEKMSACLNEMNINNNNNFYINNNNNNNNNNFNNEDDNSINNTDYESAWFCMEDAYKDRSSRSLIEEVSKRSRLEFMSDFRLNLKENDILPKSVVDDIVKPGLQLVLWKAPGNIIVDEIKKCRQKTEVDENKKDEEMDRSKKFTDSDLNIDFDEYENTNLSLDSNQSQLASLDLVPPSISQEPIEELDFNADEEMDL